jgi:hypothetical protein
MTSGYGTGDGTEVRGIAAQYRSDRRTWPICKVMSLNKSGTPFQTISGDSDWTMGL